MQEKTIHHGLQLKYSELRCICLHICISGCVCVLRARVLKSTMAKSSTAAAKCSPKACSCYSCGWRSYTCEYSCCCRTLQSCMKNGSAPEDFSNLIRHTWLLKYEFMLFSNIFLNCTSTSSSLAGSARVQYHWKYTHINVRNQVFSHM